MKNKTAVTVRRDPEYRHSYNNKDIYEAVIADLIRNIEDFKQFIKAQQSQSS